MSKRALIVVNLAGFLNFLWNDIDILQKMGYRVDVAMNGCMSDGKEAIEISMLRKMKIRYYQIDFDTKNPLTIDNWNAYKKLKQVLENGYDTNN